jgi:hypothetical protein
VEPHRWQAGRRPRLAPPLPEHLTPYRPSVLVVQQ